ncbi:uncharacterized protein LOC135477971 isoform X2 [Liolophura sinensis]|uniref:uncharacterized protein LOC135477971 isoform X2 n=1 Tax=Liolophura sinensis TaxID=3198878 RepID=UPI0031581073
MEVKTTIVVSVFVTLFLTAQVLSAPMSGEEGESEISADKRPKYMDTRELEDAFKSLILSSIQELVVEGKLNSEILPSDEEAKEVKADKRGRQGLCWRRSNGKVRPFFCWRGNK